MVVGLAGSPVEWACRSHRTAPSRAANISSSITKCQQAIQMVYCGTCLFAAKPIDLLIPHATAMTIVITHLSSVTLAMGSLQRVNIMSTTPSKVGLLEGAQQYEQLTANTASIVCESGYISVLSRDLGCHRTCGCSKRSGDGWPMP